MLHATMYASTANTGSQALPTRLSYIDMISSLQLSMNHDQVMRRQCVQICPVAQNISLQCSHTLHL